VTSAAGRRPWEFRKVVAVVVLDTPAARVGHKLQALLRGLAQHLLQMDQDNGVTAVD
jgi:hypothetical protein